MKKTLLFIAALLLFATDVLAIPPFPCVTSSPGTALGDLGSTGYPYCTYAAGSCTWTSVPAYWNNGGKTITNPTTSDIYQHFYCFVARHLTKANMIVVGGTSVAGKLQKCNSVGASCSDISDSLTVNAGAVGTFLYSAAAINTSLSADDTIYFVPTTVTGAVTSLTVNLGGVIP